MRSPYLVHHFLEHSARARGAEPFLIDAVQTASFGEVDAAANRTARLLTRLGVARGDRVALLIVNSPGYGAAYFGALKAGAVAVPLNLTAGATALRDCLADCGARAVIAGPHLGKLLTAALAELPERPAVLCAGPPPPGLDAVALDEALPAESNQPLDLPLIDLDLAAIIYTSGSTGRQRGVTLSHRNLVTNTQSILAYLELRSSERALAVLPFSYVYGASVLNTHAAAGATVVIENRFLYPEVALDTLEREECTSLAGVPSTFAILLNRSTFATRKLASLRYVSQAGGAMSPDLTHRLVAALPGRQVFVMYGATEAGARLAYLDPADLPRKVGSIGKAIPNVELRVLRDDGSEAAVGEVGEIVARGSNLMVGYWRDPEETARVLDAQGYRTGDLARRDAAGFLFIEGRKRDFIKAGAHRLSAQRIEDAICGFPAVHEAAAIGEPDEILGERIVAFVVFRDGAVADPSGLAKYLRGVLPAYAQPSAIEVWPELPKNQAGKVMKQALRRARAGQ